MDDLEDLTSALTDSSSSADFRIESVLSLAAEIPLPVGISQPDSTTKEVKQPDSIIRPTSIGLSIGQLLQSVVGKPTMSGTNNQPEHSSIASSMPGPDKRLPRAACQNNPVPKTPLPKKGSKHQSAGGRQSRTSPTTVPHIVQLSGHYNIIPNAIVLYKPDVTASAADVGWKLIQRKLVDWQPELSEEIQTVCKCVYLNSILRFCPTSTSSRL